MFLCYIAGENTFSEKYHNFRGFSSGTLCGDLIFTLISKNILISWILALFSKFGAKNLVIPKIIAISLLADSATGRK